MSIARKILMGAAGAGGDKTYVDDVFSIDVNIGTGVYPSGGSNQTITNGIDLAGEGGMVWHKSRNYSARNVIWDTERGNTKHLYTDGSNAETTDTVDPPLASFNSDGFTLGDGSSGWDLNRSPYTQANWTFRKQKGFFDVVTWTGDGSSNRQISHSLSSIPGCIMVKNLTDGAEDWLVYHRSLGDTTLDERYKALFLNRDTPQDESEAYWFGTNPTSTNFTVGASSKANRNGDNFVAYVFAGGDSTAATARSVSFATGNSTYLDIADHSDFTFGTDDFTIECWYKADDLNLSNSWDYIFSSGWPVQLAHTVGGSGSRFTFYMADSNSTSSYIISDLNTGGGSVDAGQWYHVAVTRSGSTFRIFLDGVLKNTATSSGSAPAPNANSAIGRFTPSSPYYYADGKISNFRYVKGTAVYTESFRPPTEPLTDITNTKLLCCNSSSVTGSTVTPGTITNNSAIASTESPFDDAEGFKFGEGGDQNIVKCGSYIGNGSSNGPDINLGWEPQWFIVKNATSGSTNWLLFDSMRGLTDSDQSWEANIKPNSSDAEWDNEYLSPTSRGFRLTNGGSTWVNENNSKFIYIAIRRPDGYVGKPAEAGTDVFAMDYGNSSPTGSNGFDSGFPVDYSFFKQPSISGTWYTCARLVQGRQWYTNLEDAAANASGRKFDSNVGWNTGTNSDWLSWMWKRHAGFDVVTYKGNDVNNRQILHSLSKTPEMIWTKNTDAAEDWAVYHKDLQTNYFLRLNLTSVEGYNNAVYEGNPAVAPTSTYWQIGDNDMVNNNNADYITMLFASVDGISSVGSYSGSSSDVTITTGFTPRFVLIKRTNGGSYWHLFDSLRGMGASGNDSQLILNLPNAQQTNKDFVNTTATGFVAKVGADGDTNVSGGQYIYYAHA